MTSNLNVLQFLYYKDIEILSFVLLSWDKGVLFVYNNLSIIPKEGGFDVKKHDLKKDHIFPNSMLMTDMSLVCFSLWIV